MTRLRNALAVVFIMSATALLTMAGAIFVDPGELP